MGGRAGSLSQGVLPLEDDEDETRRNPGTARDTICQEVIHERSFGVLRIRSDGGYAVAIGSPFTGLCRLSALLPFIVGAGMTLHGGRRWAPVGLSAERPKR